MLLKAFATCWVWCLPQRRDRGRGPLLLRRRKHSSTFLPPNGLVQGQPMFGGDDPLHVLWLSLRVSIGVVCSPGRAGRAQERNRRFATQPTTSPPSRDSGCKKPPLPP